MKYHSWNVRIWSCLLLFALLLGQTGCSAAGDSHSGKAQSGSAEAEQTQSGLTVLYARTEAVSSEDNLYFRDPEYYVGIDRSVSPSMKKEVTDGLSFVSDCPGIVAVDERTGELNGVGIGMAQITIQDADNNIVDCARAYCFRPTVCGRDTQNNTRANPSELHTSNDFSPNRSYPLVCQQCQDDKPYGEYLRHHGCSICACSAICLAFGAEEMTVDWMMTGGVEEIARESGLSMKDNTLGFYGMKKVLQYGGIHSTIYANWDSVPSATEEMVRCLSEARPVLFFLDNQKGWNGIDPLCKELHCVTAVGMDEDGYLEIINSSYPHQLNAFYQPSRGENGELCQVMITPGDLLEHFLRSSNKRRSKQDDFFFTKRGGMQTFLEVD